MSEVLYETPRRFRQLSESGVELYYNDSEFRAILDWHEVLQNCKAYVADTHAASVVLFQRLDADARARGFESLEDACKNFVPL